MGRVAAGSRSRTTAARVHHGSARAGLFRVSPDLVFPKFLIGLLTVLALTHAAPGGQVCQASFPDFPGQGKNAPACSVVILTFSGGWGNAALSRESNLWPVAAGLDTALRRMGLSSAIVEQNRTREDGPGYLTSATEIIGLHHTQSRHFARALSGFRGKLRESRCSVVSPREIF